MPKLRFDEFINELRQLARIHPEYASILNSLIDLIKKGKEDSIEEKLRQLKNENW